MKELTDKQIRKMILNLIEEIDYDIWKSFDPKLSEDPDDIEDKMNNLIIIAKKHLDK